MVLPTFRAVVMTRVSAPILVLLSLSLGGCVSTRQEVALPPPGPACAPLIAEFQDQLQRDVESGNLKRDVYGRASADTKQAADACAAGRQVQARSILVATKRNYGYNI